jgi:hypothetical protein
VKAVYGTRSDRHCAMSIGKGRGLLMFRLALAAFRPHLSWDGLVSHLHRSDRILVSQPGSGMHFSTFPPCTLNSTSTLSMPCRPCRLWPCSKVLSPFPLLSQAMLPHDPSTSRPSTRSISLLPPSHQSAVHALSLVFRSWKDAKRMSGQRCRRARGTGDSRFCLSAFATRHR